MIGRLRGNILEKQPPLVLLEANGVGYEVHMPMTCFYELPETGARGHRVYPICGARRCTTAVRL